MSHLFRRHSNILCFFCQTPVSSLPKDIRNFKCPTCACWNKYDANGEIISDEPAMYDENLNKDSFAKRASPRRDRFPTSYGPGPFCHTCQTNQMLLMNLLSSYLPPPEHPDYAQRLEMFPEYKESLHMRYPPVCESCMPGVEDEIRRKDQMARAKALGASLRNSRGKENKRRVPGKGRVREKETTEFYWWKIRGGLWFTTSTVSFMFNATAALGYRPFYLLGSIQPVLPLFVLLTIFWTVWDPTYASFRRAQKQGRDVRVIGKKEYIVLQMIVWSTRLLTSVLFWLWWYSPENNHFELYDPSSQLARIYFSTITTIELTAQGLSFSCLRLKHPPTVRLIDTRTHLSTPSRSSTPYSSGSMSHGETSLTSQPSTSICSTPIEPDFSVLSLSSKPVMTHKKPVFGLPSLLSNLPTQKGQEHGHHDIDIDPNDGDGDDENAMDWTPTDPRIATRRKRKNGQLRDDVYLRPPKFFAPEQPTGLESLFARTSIDDDVMMLDGQEDSGGGRLFFRKVGRYFKRWSLICATVIVPVLVAVLVRRAWNLDINITSLQKEPQVVVRMSSPSPFPLDCRVEVDEFA
ncbi:hypothetical protein Agabi119p4_808 [Agaricus bisporus var. burnettii]|uniref:Ima1 N-terminal domain-containing protein n=1 Tax=Agaricus bisporus var. burnettii TaxID=192524 RepID=A0A8H7KL42_AGABI|nr:hypothetical protein Agabi119p4_808 [Agaricus bisporus var. burnettii]